MKIDKAESSPCSHVFKVELGGEEFAGIRNHAFSEVAERASIPGFRKGRVPQNIIEQRYGREIEQDAVDHVISAAARQILEDPDLIPIVRPQVSNVNRSGGGLAFSITVEVAPKVALGEYRGVELWKDSPVVRPEEVDSVIEELRRRSVRYEDAGRPGRWGDLCIVDYDVEAEGRLLESAAGKDVMVFVGSREALREIEDGLIGRSKGEEFGLDVSYPPEYVNRDLAGKKGHLAVRVKEVKTAKLPDLDDEFARSAGGAEGLEDLRRKAVERLRAERSGESDKRVRASLVDKLLGSVPAAVPATIVDEEIRYMAVRGAEELSRQGMKSIEQLGLKAPQFREMFRGAAVRAVREAFLLDAIAQAEGLSVSDEDLEREIRENGGSDEGGREKLIASLKADGRWDRLRGRLLQDRALTWVLERAKVREGVLCL